MELAFGPSLALSPLDLIVECRPLCWLFTVPVFGGAGDKGGGEARESGARDGIKSGDFVKFDVDIGRVDEEVCNFVATW